MTSFQRTSKNSKSATNFITRFARNIIFIGVVQPRGDHLRKKIEFVQFTQRFVMLRNDFDIFHIIKYTFSH